VVIATQNLTGDTFQLATAWSNIVARRNPAIKLTPIEGCGTSKLLRTVATKKADIGYIGSPHYRDAVERVGSFAQEPPELVERYKTIRALFAIYGGIPQAGLYNASRSHKLRYLSLDPGSLPAFAKAMPNGEWYVYRELSPETIKAAYGEGFEVSGPVYNWAFPMMLVVRADMPDDLAYTLVKELWENIEEAKKNNTQLKDLSLDKVPAHKIEWIALRLCIVAFLFPLLWVYQPEVMLQNLSIEALPSVIFACASLTFAVVLLAAVQVGYFRGRLAIWERVALGVAAALIYWPETYPTIIGTVLGGALLTRRLVAPWRAGEARNRRGIRTEPGSGPGGPVETTKIFRPADVTITPKLGRVESQ
jgi:TRAP-type uncharacterized transport system substrate-binding protein